MNGYLLGTTTLGGKQYTYNDVTALVGTGQDDSFYGGQVRQLGLTKEGLLLCFHYRTNEILNILASGDHLTEEGRELVEEYLDGKDINKLAKVGNPEGDKTVEEINIETPDEDETIDVDTAKRPDLLKMASKLNLKGKISTFKTEELRELVKEALKEDDSDAKENA
ncbi:MAG: hypothetical protein ACM3TR_09860 [Caulobacteraceae bacterium]